MSHWIAAQYVVIEGWKELKLKDKEIDNLLGACPTTTNPKKHLSPV
jgi:hypothetical protein